jgi:hypothetical protein
MGLRMVDAKVVAEIETETVIFMVPVEVVDRRATSLDSLSVDKIDENKVVVWH